MSQVRIRAELINEDRYYRRLTEMSARAKNLTPIFVWAQQELRKANAENFTANGLPVGGWAPLSPQYAAWKAMHFPAPPMQVTGRLFRSLTSLAGPANVITPTWAQFGTDIEYAKFHQYGTTKMPARQIVYEPTGFAREFGSRVIGYVANGISPDAVIAEPM